MNRRNFILSGAVLAGSTVSRVSNAARTTPRFALVLGGGGCRGYGHIGVLKVLEQQGLRPDLIVGSSAGALVGALYAAGQTATEIERAGSGLSPNLLRDWIFPRLGLFGGDRIRRFVIERVGERQIESLPMRYAAVATDLVNGAMHVFDRGDLGQAVQASSSAPGLLEPVRLGGRLFVDGNLVAPVPVDAGRSLGARRIVAVDVTFPPDQALLADPYDALYQGFSILTRRLAVDAMAKADIAISPELPPHVRMDAAMRGLMIEAGERAAHAALPGIRKMLGSATNTPGTRRRSATA